MEPGSGVGAVPLVIDDQLDDYGAAYPGFLIFQLQTDVTGLNTGEVLDLRARMRSSISRARRKNCRLFCCAARATTGLVDHRWR